MVDNRNPECQINGKTFYFVSESAKVEIAEPSVSAVYDTGGNPVNTYSYDGVQNMITLEVIAESDNIKKVKDLYYEGINKINFTIPNGVSVAGTNMKLSRMPVFEFGKDKTIVLEIISGKINIL